MEKMKLGLIGLGYIGRVHLYNCLNLESAKLQAVSDISRKALKLAEKVGVKKTYNDYSKLLNDDSIDAVIIALPTHLHASCVKEAAEAGKHIFLEKPLARNPLEGKDIVSAIRKNGTKFMVGYPFRFASSFQALKENIESGELGEVHLAYATNVASGPFMHRAEGDIPHPVPDWWFNKELTGGGALMDVGSHMVNLARWYLGEISSVRSYLGHRFNFDIEDHAICLFKFQSGTLAIVNVGWFSQQTEVKVELYGTVAHASADLQPPSKVRTAIQLMMRRTPTFYLYHLKELSYFVQCLRQDLTPSPSAEDALKDLEAISLAYGNQIQLN